MKIKDFNHIAYYAGVIITLGISMLIGQLNGMQFVTPWFLILNGINIIIFFIIKCAADSY